MRIERFDRPSYRKWFIDETIKSTTLKHPSSGEKWRFLFLISESEFQNTRSNSQCATKPVGVAYTRFLIRGIIRETFCRKQLESKRTLKGWSGYLINQILLGKLTKMWNYLLLFSLTDQKTWNYARIIPGSGGQTIIEHSFS